MKQNEEKLQAECVRIFRYMHQPLTWSYFAIPNGGLRNAIVAHKMKLTGTLSGVWDTLLILPKKGYSGLFVEFKAGKNKLTENQIAFREENKAHYAFEVCYTVEEFLKAIANYLN